MPNFIWSSGKFIEIVLFLCQNCFISIFSCLFQLWKWTWPQTSSSCAQAWWKMPGYPTSSMWSILQLTLTHMTWISANKTFCFHRGRIGLFDDIIFSASPISFQGEKVSQCFNSLFSIEVPALRYANEGWFLLCLPLVVRDWNRQGNKTKKPAQPVTVCDSLWQPVTASDSLWQPVTVGSGLYLALLVCTGLCVPVLAFTWKFTVSPKFLLDFGFFRREPLSSSSMDFECNNMWIASIRRNNLHVLQRTNYNCNNASITAVTKNELQVCHSMHFNCVVQLQQRTDYKELLQRTYQTVANNWLYLTQGGLQL